MSRKTANAGTWAERSHMVIERLEGLVKAHIAKPSAKITVNSWNVFELLATLYESHCYLENLWDTKMNPLWTSIQAELERCYAKVDNPDGNGSASHAEFVQNLPTGLQNVIGELEKQKVRWHSKFETELDRVMPQSRDLFLADMREVCDYYCLQVDEDLKGGLAGARSLRGDEAGDGAGAAYSIAYAPRRQQPERGTPPIQSRPISPRLPETRIRPPTLDAHRWIEILEAHESCRVKSAQQMSAAKGHLDSIRSILDNVNKEVGTLRTFHEVGAKDRCFERGDHRITN